MKKYLKLEEIVNVLGQERQTGGVQCIQRRSEEDWMGSYRGFKVRIIWSQLIDTTNILCQVETGRSETEGDLDQAELLLIPGPLPELRHRPATLQQDDQTALVFSTMSNVLTQINNISF